MKINSNNYNSKNRNRQSVSMDLKGIEKSNNYIKRKSCNIIKFQKNRLN